MKIPHEHSKGKSEMVPHPDFQKDDFQGAPLVVVRGPLDGVVMHGDHVILEEVKRRTAGGLHMPEQAAEVGTRGRVVAHGPGQWINGTFMKCFFRIGDVVQLDTVRINQRGGVAEFNWGGVRRLMVKQDTIVAVLPETEPQPVRLVGADGAQVQ